MATVATIPVAEYLTTSYRPDREFIDGEVRERTLGEVEHSGLQTFLAFVFLRHWEEWRLTPFTECRVQVAEERFRVPDLAVVLPGKPRGDVLREPPFLCVEILSPSDSLSQMQDRLEDYLAMGVANVWVIDPVRRKFWTADQSGFHLVQGGQLTLPGTMVRVEIAEINAHLNRVIEGR